MPKLNLSADEVLRTTRAVRKRMDFDRPIDLGTIQDCLELALQAPTGSNGQQWEWVVVTDPEKIAAIAALYQEGFAAYLEMDGSVRSIYKGDDPDRIAQQGRVTDSAQYLADNMHRCPALLLPVLPMKLDGMPNFVSASLYAGIMPAAWSFCLAARERGIGTSWTSIHLMFEEQVADILGIPFAEASQIALIAMAYTLGTDFKPAAREPLARSLHVNRW
jgi:nitroreductase